MNGTTYAERYNALYAQLDEPNRLILGKMVLWNAAIRLAVFTCAAFGICATTEISQWFALPIAAALYNTLGRLWWLATRHHHLTSMERMIQIKTTPKETP
jgi:hypothetical protein